MPKCSLHADMKQSLHMHDYYKHAGFQLVETVPTTRTEALLLEPVDVSRPRALKALLCPPAVTDFSKDATTVCTWLGIWGNYFGWGPWWTKPRLLGL